MISIFSALSVLVVARSVAGFTFSHSQPVECQNMTVQWNGGTPPFYATIVPAYPITGARIQNVTIPTASGSAPYSYSFRLDNPAGLEFSVVMSDATGWGTGGVTPVLQIDPSSDQSCHSTPPPFGFYFYWDPPMSISSAQCQPLRLSWDSNLVYPIQALVIVPGSSAFSIPVPQTSASLSTTWPVSIREGAQYQILMAHSGQVATGGSTNLTWVTAGPSGCLNANSPGPGVRVATILSSGTSGPTAVTSARPSASMSASMSGRPVSDSSGGTSSNGGNNTGAIVGGVIGGLAALALLVLLLLCCRRRRRREAQNQAGEFGTPSSTSGLAYTEPEMRQAPASMGTAAGAAAVMRRATRSMGPGHSRQPSRGSTFDILSGPSGVSSTPPHGSTPPDIETPSSGSHDAIDPFVSPFPAPPPRGSFERSGPNAVAWGRQSFDANGPTLPQSGSDTSGLGLGLTPYAPASAMSDSTSSPPPLAPPTLAPLNTGGAVGVGATAAGAGTGASRHSKKISGQYNETPPQTPVVRASNVHPRSPSSGQLNRWSVDEDEHIGSDRRTPAAGGGIGAGGQQRETPERRTTFIQHNDAGPGNHVVELPPSYQQLRARNPDPDHD